MRRFIIILALFFMLPYVSEAKNRIIISKSDFSLKVINEKDSILFECKVAYGKKNGTKTSKGDYRTPEGHFSIREICNSTHWKYYPPSGGPYRMGVYGPIFLRLAVPGFSGIGIHGTSSPKSIGTKASMGCIRCHNADIKVIATLVEVGTEVIILPEFN